MKKQFPKTLKRIVPLLLAVMLIASAMFVPGVVSAETATEADYEAVGLHTNKTTEFDFEDGKPEVMTLGAGATVKDGCLSTPKSAGTTSFGVYPDIETFSFDMKPTGSTPKIYFYSEEYTYIDESGTKQTVTSASTYIDFYKNSGKYQIRLSNTLKSGTAATCTWPLDSNSSKEDWVTVKLTYSTTPASNTSKDIGNVLFNNKYLSSITLTKKDETNAFFTYTPGSGSNNFDRHLTRYGVNYNLKEDGIDDGKVTIKIVTSTSTAAASIDNIKVTYRGNAARVKEYIKAIGDVTATDECRAKIERAEKAYPLLTEAEKATIAADYATLTAARTTYNALTDTSTSAEFEEFETTYTKTTSTVTYADAENIDAALDLYDNLNDDQKANYADEKAALDKLKDVADLDKEVRAIVVTPADINTAAAKQAEYEALDVDNASIEDAIENIETTVDTYRAKVNGCTIKALPNPQMQDLRYEYSAPTGAAEGWYVKEYGALFVPEKFLSGALTLDTQYVASGKVELEEGNSVPDTFYANLGGSAVSGENCAMNIAGTAYVIWTNGTDDYVYYCNSDVDNSDYTENVTAAGVGVRSVYGVARKIAEAIYGKTEYGTITYTDKVTKDGDLASFADADVLAFLAVNVDAVSNYVKANKK